LGHYCNHHIAQGVKDHSSPAYKGQVLVEPYTMVDKCMGHDRKGARCANKAVWLTTCTTDAGKVWMLVTEPTPPAAYPSVILERR